MIIDGLENVIKATRGLNPTTFEFVPSEGRKHYLISHCKTGETMKISVDALLSAKFLEDIDKGLSPEEQVLMLHELSKNDIPTNLIEIYSKGEKYL